MSSVSKRRRIVASPLTVPACSKYPTPDRYSVIRRMGRSIPSSARASDAGVIASVVPVISASATVVRINMVIPLGK